MDYSTLNALASRGPSNFFESNLSQFESIWVILGINWLKLDSTDSSFWKGIMGMNFFFKTILNHRSFWWHAKCSGYNHVIIKKHFEGAVGDRKTMFFVIVIFTDVKKWTMKFEWTKNRFNLFYFLIIFFASPEPKKWTVTN